MGRTGMGSRPLRSREPMPGKSSRALPRTPLGRAFCFYLVAMGTTARLAPRLTHCSWPQTPSVGSPHQDTTQPGQLR